MNGFLAVIGSLVAIARGEDQANLWLQVNYTKESYHNKLSDKGLDVFQEFHSYTVDERSAVSTGVWTADNVGYNLTFTGSGVEVEVFGMEYKTGCGGDLIGTKCFAQFPEPVVKTKQPVLWVRSTGIYTAFMFLVLDWHEGENYQVMLGNWTHGGNLVPDHSQVTLNLPVRECPTKEPFGFRMIDNPHIYHGTPNEDYVWPDYEPIKQVSFSTCGHFSVASAGPLLVAYLAPQAEVNGL